MDTRRLLIPALAALACGCAGSSTVGATEVMDPVSTAAVAPLDAPALRLDAAIAPAPGATTQRPYRPAGAEAAGVSGRRAIAAANRASRAASREDDFMGGVQVFAWSPGRVYEVWAAPLRVTTLTLSPGETIRSKAAGDTIRWQIGEAVSGAGTTARTHVLLKPLQRDLSTNLVLATDRRVYFIELRSGAVETFNAAVAWAVDDPPDIPPPPPAAAVVEAVGTGLEAGVDPGAILDGGYDIAPRGRRPRWTPTSAFNDGRRTFITFDADIQVDEAPALFVIAADGSPELVNYRQIGGLFVVDRLFDRAELRLGDRRPQVVRIERTGRGRS